MTTSKLESDRPIRDASANEFADLTRDAHGIPIFPWLLTVSGLYEHKAAGPLRPLPPIPHKIPTPIPIPFPFPGPQPHLEGGSTNGTSGSEDQAGQELHPIWPWWFQREELRLDVDGRYPQMTASGSLYNGAALRVHWIASLVLVAPDEWTGDLWYKDGTTAALPHTNVRIKASRSYFAGQQSAVATFTGGGAPKRTIHYDFKSRYFHPVEFEFDSATGVTAVTAIDTHAHPNRPATLTNETLTIENVFRRAGFDVKDNASGGVPIAGAGPNATWSDAEMHDAMQVYWSKFADKPQWSMWTLFASLHDTGTSLGGIMFDDIGPNHRQGTAMFNDSFIKNAPAGDAAPAAWVARMRFWTACHEMGHSFNLAHSWQKSHPPAWGTPWIPLVNEDEARSFMNYPYNVSGGQAAFFADFRFRFSDSELLFMRHAPERFVQMGNADWFENHGFREAELAGPGALRLELAANRHRPEFDYLEPIVLEARLINASGRIQVVDEKIISGTNELMVIIKKDGKPARQWLPFAEYCHEVNMVALAPGEAVLGSLFISAGRNGWDLAEPGLYSIQALLRYGNEEIVSAPMPLRVAPPRGHEEQVLAQDLFNTEVGRVMAFDGSRYLSGANASLRNVAERLPKAKVAYHARIALAAPSLSGFKRLNLEGRVPVIVPESVDTGSIKTARKEMTEALLTDASVAAQTLGYVDYEYYVERYSGFLERHGEADTAAEARGAMRNVLAEGSGAAASERGSLDRDPGGSRSAKVGGKGSAIKR
jgi:hypothetical protein